jgi:hypothetical protein
MNARAGKSLAALAAAALLVACQNPMNPTGNYGSISGRVTTASGQPVAGVTVTVDSGPYATTGADGTYTITTVPVTDALTPDVVAVTSVPSGFAIPPSRNNIQVTAGQTTTGINFVLSSL